MANAENTAAKQLEPYQFKKGQSGNPAGRPKGSRNKLQEAFLADMLDAWEQQGATAIQQMIADKPGDFVKVVASILPKEASLTINDNSDLSDEELHERIKALASQLGPFLPGGTGNADEGIAIEGSAQKSTGVH